MKIWKRLWSIALCLCLLCGLLPVPARAEAVPEQTGQEQTVLTPGADGQAAEPDAQEPSEEPLENPSEEPLENPSEEPLENPSEEPAEEPAEESAKGPAGEEYDESAAAVRAAQALIDALPDEVTAENAEALQAQLIAIDEALAALTEEQTAALDMTRWSAICAALAGQTAAQEGAHTHTICVNAAKCKNPEHSENDHGGSVTWTAWDGTSDIPYDTGTKTAYVYLTDNVTWTSNATFTVKKGCTLYLCLNGHTITAKCTDAEQVISVSGSLILSDCCGGGTIMHGADISGSGVRVKSGGTFIMYGGTISGNKSPYYGGGVGIIGGNFKMYGGTIRDNESTYTNSESYGGGVYVDSGTFEMYSGTITDNKASDQQCGGGVGICNNGSFTMYGGTISKNTAAANTNYAAGGGGVYVKSGTFEMKGGDITGNKATNNGGGVEIIGGTFKMEKGTISSNTAASDGGGVFIGGCRTLELQGGTISGNTANNNGGGVWTKRELTISGTTIANNTANGDGGGVYVDDIYGSYSLTVSDSAEIEKNNAANGGGIYVAKGTLKLTGGAISDNTATENGGGVYFGGESDSKLNLSGDISITGNKGGCTAAADGTLTSGTDNNVYLPDGKTITVAGELTGVNKIGVTTEKTPNSSECVKIATATSVNSGYADPDKFTYINKSTDGKDIPLIKITNTDGSADIFACVHNWGRGWETDNSEHWHTCSICNGKDSVGAHLYDRTVTAEGYLASAATCIAKATYYKSCECGKKSDTETFTSGEKNPDNHSGQPGEWQMNDDIHWKEYSCCHAEVDKAEHSWNEGKITTESTCTEEGVRTFTCTVCGRTKTETVNAKGHEWSTDWTSDAGKHWHKCSRCDAVNEEAAHTGGTATCTEQAVCETCNQPYGELAAHTWTAATCTAPKTCSRCQTTEGDPLGHDWLTDWTSDADQHWHKCSRCGAATDENPHTWDNGKVTTPADCMNAGVKTYTCRVCGATKDEQIGALGHSFEGGDYQHDGTQHWKECSRCGAADTKVDHSGGTATCKEQAVCTVCNQPYGDLGPHNWTAATCTEPKTCSVCQTTEGTALGHDWGRYVADETKEGMETRICARDSSHTLTRPIPKLPASTYGVSGKVHDKDGDPIEDVIVTLVLGDREIAKLKDGTGPDGKFGFTKVAPGIYNLVAEKDGVTMTVKVTVVNEDVTDVTVIMPEGKTNSVVEVKSDDPSKNVEAVVGNLDQIFEADEGKAAYTTEDKDVVNGGGSVEIKLTVTKTNAAATDEIKKQLTGSARFGLRLDLDVNKTVRKSTEGPTEDPTVTPISDTGILLETTIRLPDSLRGKSSYTVYRLHNGTVHKLTTTPNEKGEYITVSADRTTLTIHARFYSEYVIAYQESSGGGGGGGGGGGSYTPSTPASTPEQPKGDTVCPKDASCPLSRFSDLTAAAWYHDGVHYCIENGLMQGRSDGTFQPNGSVTRAQLTAILWRLESSPAVSGGETFRDVTADAWCAGAVRWAVKEGIVQGYRDGRFDPGAPVTRQQAAAILYRYALYKGMDVRVGEDTNILSFADALTVSEYAFPAMQWACGSGVMNGRAQDGGMILAPRSGATRAQMAAMIARFCAADAK